MVEQQVLIDAATRYIGAYNEPDPALSLQLLKDSLSADCRYVSENQELDFDGVVGMASDFHDVASMRIEGEVRVHGAYGTFRWSFTETASDETTTGLDFCVFGDHGRIDRVIVFFD